MTTTSRRQETPAKRGLPTVARTPTVTMVALTVLPLKGKEPLMVARTPMVMMVALTGRHPRGKARLTAGPTQAATTVVPTDRLDE
jgi:hypothetical protein